jgi:hypothetical protein
MNNCVPKRKSHVVLNVFRSGDKVLLDLKNRQTYKLNDVSMKIWSLFDGVHTVEDIANLIFSEFDVNFETAQRDLKEFIDKLLLLGIIEI